MPAQLRIDGMDGAVGRTPEYRTWINMKSRCSTPSSTGFEHYGGRGIKVCERWANSFEAFYADMGLRPSPKHSLDRFPDTDGNYEPENCRWATGAEQARNTRRNRLVEVAGGKVVLTAAITASGLKQSTVANRLRRGWPIKAALSRPLQRGVKYAP